MKEKFKVGDLCRQINEPSHWPITYKNGVYLVIKEYDCYTPWKPERTYAMLHQQTGRKLIGSNVEFKRIKT